MYKNYFLTFLNVHMYILSNIIIININCRKHVIDNSNTKLNTRKSEPTAVANSNDTKDEKIAERRKSERTIKPKVIYSLNIEPKKSALQKNECSKTTLLKNLKLPKQKLIKCFFKDCKFEGFKNEHVCHYLKTHLVRLQVKNFI